MHFRFVVALVGAASIMAGCGFTPKQPAQPDLSHRVPVNLAAPFTKPWPPPLPEPLVAQAHEIRSATMATPIARYTSAIGDQTEKFAPAGADPHSPVIANEVQPSNGLVDQVGHPIIWPVIQPFKSAESIGQHPVIRQVTFAWSSQSHERSPRLEKGDFDTAQVNEPKQVAAEQPHTIESNQAPIPAKTFAVQPQSLEVEGTVNAGSTLYVARDMVSEPMQPRQEQADAPVTNQVAVPASKAIEELTPLSDLVVAKSLTPQPEVKDSNDLSESIEAAHTGVSQQPTLPAIPTWSATAGASLYELLSDWAAREEWMVSWETAVHYRIEAPFTIDAPDFLSAAGRLLQAYMKAGQSLIAVAHRNKVLVIRTP